MANWGIALAKGLGMAIDNENKKFAEQMKESRVLAKQRYQKQREAEMEDYEDQQALRQRLIDAGIEIGPNGEPKGDLDTIKREYHTHKASKTYEGKPLQDEVARRMETEDIDFSFLKDAPEKPVFNPEGWKAYADDVKQGPLGNAIGNAAKRIREGVMPEQPAGEPSAATIQAQQVMGEDPKLFTGKFEVSEDAGPPEDAKLVGFAHATDHTKPPVVLAVSGSKVWDQQGNKTTIPEGYLEAAKVAPKAAEDPFKITKHITLQNKTTGVRTPGVETPSGIGIAEGGVVSLVDPKEYLNIEGLEDEDFKYGVSVPMLGPDGKTTRTAYQSDKGLVFRNADGTPDTNTEGWTQAGKSSSVPIYQQKMDKIAEINTSLANPELDDQQRAILEDQKAFLMGNMSESADKMRTMTRTAKQSAKNNIDLLDIGLGNAQTLMNEVTAQQAGVRAFLTKFTDNAEAYISGMLGSEETASMIVAELNAVSEGRGDALSDAIQQGKVDALAEIIKYDIANSLKDGQRLTANDLERADSMLNAPFGSDRFAGQLQSVISMMNVRKEKVVKQLMIDSEISPQAYKGAFPDRNGVMRYWYQDGDRVRPFNL